MDLDLEFSSGKDFDMEEGMRAEAVFCEELNKLYTRKKIRLTINFFGI